MYPAHQSFLIVIFKSLALECIVQIPPRQIGDKMIDQSKISKHPYNTHAVIRLQHTSHKGIKQLNARQPVKTAIATFVEA
jgi:hypothetical protein